MNLFTTFYQKITKSKRYAISINWLTCTTISTKDIYAHFRKQRKCKGLLQKTIENYQFGSVWYV